MTVETFEEEEWEAGIAGLLGALPMVDPPPGVVERAIDHRPLHAGRTSLLLGLSAVAALGVWIGSDVLRSGNVVPPVSDLVAHHESTADSDSFFGSASAGLTIGSGDDAVTVQMVESDPGLSVALPDGYERTGTFAASEFEQQLFASGASAVSVFSQPGEVVFDELPAGGRTTIDGVPAWIDAGNDTVVIQAADSAVTIVGLDEDEIAEVIRSIPVTNSFLGDVAERLNSLTTQLGFSDLQ